MDVKYPHVDVQLTGQDGNGAAIIGRVARELRHKVSREAADQWIAEAMDSGSYDGLLQLAMRTVTVH